MKRTWSQAQEPDRLGIIESVSLRNFMCHDNLSFDFDPHMNFIIGRNGSGKSAVLTGIILALGGKSGATGRYNNIKGFVKTGKNSATVAVTLKNCGPEAYKPDEFGKKIIVERYFNSDGISSYKLKSEKGRILSTSKEELTNILNIMDIQIDNPITVLTQDTSRNFLVSKNSRAEKLFQLFYKGTGLANVHEDYNRAAQQKTEAKLELANKKSVLPEMEKDIKKLKALLDKSSKITELKKELLWAIVIELEKKRDETQAEVEKVRKSISDITVKLQDYRNELASLNQSISSIQTEKKASNDKMNAIRKELMELNPKKATLSSEIREVHGTYSSHDREVKKFSAEIKSLENIIEDIRMKNQSDLKEEKLKHDLAVDNLKTQIYNTEVKINLLENQKKAAHESIAAKSKKLDVSNAEIQEIHYEKTNVMRERQQLMEGLTNRINVFGPEMAQVLREVKIAAQNRKFKIEPKGPIGLYINVKQPEWNFAVQECLKTKLLKTFLCDNYEDSDVLSEIFNKYYPRNQPSIIVTRFLTEVYDVSSHKTVCEYPTLLDMLDTQDPVITNCLIDQARIENVLLIADSSQAVNLMLYNPPNKCMCAYTTNGDQYCPSPYRVYSCRNMNRICILKTVNEDDIRKKDEELRKLDMDENQKRLDKENLVEMLKVDQQAINMKDNEIMQLKIKKNQLTSKLKDEENNFEEPKDINCLHNDLVQLQQEKQHHKERLADCRQIMDTKSEELKTLDKKMDELKRDLQVESRNFHSLSEKIDECQNKLEKLDSRIKKFEASLKDLQPHLEKGEEELSNDNGAVLVATKNALDVGPRIETRRSSDNIRQILKETEKFIHRQKNCDRQALLSEYEEKIENLNKAKSELERQEKINARLDQMMGLRLLEFQKICKNTSVSLTCQFTSYLGQNNFSGYPDVNFEKQTLEIVAKPQKMAAKLGKHNLAQLSGGERSYVTIAFLLSLWDRIKTPFRILDEYDVFMDSNNRHLSIHLLINTAKSNPNVQYIFLSPLELPQIEDSDHVKVHKMPAPRK